MRGLERIRAALRGGARAATTLLSEDRVVAWVALAHMLHLLALIGWDIPSSFGWENDGIAPRDLFGGLAFNLQPGHGHRYPLFHYVVVAVAALPVLLTAVVSAHSWSGADLQAAMLSVPAMTGIALVAKLIAVAASGLSLLIAARLARRLFGVVAGRVASLAFATCLALAYYGRVSNLDGPALCWTLLALDRLLDVHLDAYAERRSDPRSLRWFAVFCALSIATKDQAYAAYVLPALVYLVALPALTLRGQQRRAHFVALGRAVLLGALVLGVAGGGLLNPTGFLVRLRMLVGTNSQDWRVYARTLAGVFANVRDLARGEARDFWPLPWLWFAWAGVAWSIVRSLLARAEPAAQRWLRLLPLLAGTSSTLFFTLVVARADARFQIVLAACLTVYGGAAGARVFALARASMPRIAASRFVVAAILGALLVHASLGVLALDLTQLRDARIAAEDYFAKQPRVTRVETYGLTVYQPRFHRAPLVRVSRVGPERAAGRNPIPGMLEVSARFSDYAARAPDLLVVSSLYADRYLDAPRGAGFASSSRSFGGQGDDDARTFFRAALRGQLRGYHLVLDARPSLPAWLGALGFEPVALHGSVGGRVLVFARDVAR